MANQSAAFLNLLPPYLDGRSVNLENIVRVPDSMCSLCIGESDVFAVERTFDLRHLHCLRSTPFRQIYDYMNVNSIHNSTFANALPPTFLEQARALANWHEYNVFSDANVSGIGNSKAPHSDSCAPLPMTPRRV